VNTAAFGRGGQFTALNRSQLQSAGVVHGALPVAPDRSSLRLSDRAVSGRFPQTRSQTFASRMQAPRVEHATFEQQQRGVQQMSRGSLSQPAGRGFGGGAGESGAHGWNRFGEPIHGTAATGAASPYGRSYSPSAAPSAAYRAGGGAFRISPPIVQQRADQSRGYSSPGNYPQPRSFGGSRSAAPSAPASRGGGAASRPSSSSGGGGHHR
jgi:hypothetical protein